MRPVVPEPEETGESESGVEGCGAVLPFFCCVAVCEGSAAAAALDPFPAWGLVRVAVGPGPDLLISVAAAAAAGVAEAGALAVAVAAGASVAVVAGAAAAGVVAAGVPFVAAAVLAAPKHCGLAGKRP